MADKGFKFVTQNVIIFSNLIMVRWVLNTPTRVSSKGNFDG